jgi:hypothetical protein
VQTIKLRKTNESDVQLLLTNNIQINIHDPQTHEDQDLPNEQVRSSEERSFAKSSLISASLLHPLHFFNFTPSFNRILTTPSESVILTLTLIFRVPRFRLAKLKKNGSLFES